MLVELPRKVAARDFHARYEGGGRFRGYVLAKIDGPVQLGGAPYISDVQPGWCVTRGCTSKSVNGVPFGHNFGRYLPAGVYRLYQVADGPMKLTLHFDSLSGVLNARPSRPVQSEIRMLRPTAGGAVTSSVFSAGEFTSLPGGKADFAAMGMWVDAAPHTVTGYGECFYEPEMMSGQVLPRDLAFAPNCPTGENVWNDGYPQYQVSDTESFSQKRVRFVISYSGAHVSGVGGWFDSASAVTDAHAVGVWLNFHGKNSL